MVNSFGISYIFKDNHIGLNDLEHILSDYKGYVILLKSRIVYFMDINGTWLVEFYDKVVTVLAKLDRRTYKSYKRDNNYDYHKSSKYL
jgi:hypothetical protein